MDLQESILQRQEGNGRVTPQVTGKTRQHDFLRGLTMKIRFMKRLSTQDLERCKDGKVIFSWCDDVQMRLTKLELSGIRLITSSDSVGMLFICAECLLGT